MVICCGFNKVTASEGGVILRLESPSERWKEEERLLEVEPLVDGNACDHWRKNKEILDLKEIT